MIPPFALAVAEAVMEVTTGEVVSLVVTSISTVAVCPAGSVGMLQLTISCVPAAAEHDPVLWVIFPVGGDDSEASPVLGATVAAKLIEYAGSGPWLRMLKVNAT